MRQQTKIIISIASIILVAVLGSIFVAIGMPWFKRQYLNIKNFIQ